MIGRRGLIWQECAFLLSKFPAQLLPVGLLLRDSGWPKQNLSFCLSTMLPFGFEYSGIL